MTLPRTIVPGFESGQRGNAPASRHRAPRGGAPHIATPRGDAPLGEDGTPRKRRRRRSGRGSGKPAAGGSPHGG